jgi:ribosome-associated protein
MSSRPIVVHTLPIELAQFLKFAGLAESGGEAKRAVEEGLVQVNGVTETRRGKKLELGDEVTFAGETLVVAAS